MRKISTILILKNIIKKENKNFPFNSFNLFNNIFVVHRNSRILSHSL